MRGVITPQLVACAVALWSLCGVSGSEDLVVGYGGVEQEWRGQARLVSWRPRLYYLKNFLTDEECDSLRALGLPYLQPSSVVNSTTGDLQPSTERTSEGAALARGKGVVGRVERRIALVTMVPESHQEDMQILRYRNGQKYLPHHDHFKHDSLAVASQGGQRLLTVLMYLSSPEEGGETVFPLADGERGGWSGCAREGLAVKARKGDAVMFYALHPNGTVDLNSLHGSCPTLAGEKWSATKWIRQWPLPHAA